MRYFFMLTLLLSFLKAQPNQIVVGTYSNIQNATKAQNDLENYIQKNQKLAAFLQESSIQTHSKPLGNYYIVTLAPIYDIATQNALHAKLQEEFKGTYVLALSKTEMQENNATSTKQTFTSEMNEEIFLDDPLLAEEPDIASLEINRAIETPSDANKSSLKKKEAIVLTKQPITKKNEITAEELNVLEKYMYEVIALIGVLLLSVVYFMIRKSKHAQEKDLEAFDVFQSSTPSKFAPQTESEVDAFDDTIKEDEVSQPMIMEDRVEQIQFEDLEGNIEGSFGELENPAQVEDAPQEDKPAKKTIKKRDVPPHGKISKGHFKEFAGTRVLVAEDNLINQKVISGLLADSGIEIVMADDGKEALDILKKDANFAFILMDAHMPRIDGFEATRQIRANPDYDHILVVALSGDTAPDDIKKMQAAGMQEHLEKPLRMDDLYDIFYAYAYNEEENSTDEFIEVVMTSELNGDEGLSVCGGDIEFYHEILNQFVENYSNSAELIHDYLANDQMQKADKLLLDIIGITANIGAIILHDIAKELKDALADTHEKSYLTLADEYHKHLHYLLRDIKAYK